MFCSSVHFLRVNFNHDRKKCTTLQLLLKFPESLAKWKAPPGLAERGLASKLSQYGIS